MKYKITELDFNKLKYSSKELQNGTIYNLDTPIEFQTPKMIIHEIIKESNHEYLLLELQQNEACRKFFLKIKELEQSIPGNLHSLLNESIFKVKVKYSFSRPLVNVYSDNKPFNYYHLSKGMEIICLLEFHKIWNYSHYNLTVKEILLKGFNK